MTQDLIEKRFRSRHMNSDHPTVEVNSLPLYHNA